MILFGRKCKKLKRWKRLANSRELCKMDEWWERDYWRKTCHASYTLECLELRPPADHASRTSGLPSSAPELSNELNVSKRRISDTKTHCT
jgi:hypothetical protein